MILYKRGTSRYARVLSGRRFITVNRAHIKTFVMFVMFFYLEKAEGKVRKLFILLLKFPNLH